MKRLFDELKEAEDVLERKGFYVSIQFDGYFSVLANVYKIEDENGKCYIDRLTPYQVIGLANMMRL